MNEPNKRLDALESFLSENESESKADSRSELRRQGVEVDEFLDRVRKIVQEGYQERLREAAATDAEPRLPGFLQNVKTMSRDAMLDIFQRLQIGEFGSEYQQLALARCRNKDAQDTTDEELRSWLDDIGDVVGDPE
ncbi:MAG: hypothetical protein DHS20C16_21780 [Phycisphaerae bacterium]|nr:MAG: hypothetical protein DHS20C16_21780 [Phycisphaerae bacterium]